MKRFLCWTGLWHDYEYTFLWAGFSEHVRVWTCRRCGRMGP